MEMLETIAKGLADHPTAWMLAITLVALAYLYKERSAIQKELVETVMKQEQAHRETLSKIVPISEKLVESIEVLERVTDALMKGSE